jgi:Zn ribbon nucleic-acid-binding protein
MDETPTTTETKRTISIRKCPRCDATPRSRGSHRVGRWRVKETRTLIIIECITCGHAAAYKTVPFSDGSAFQTRR